MRRRRKPTQPAGEPQFRQTPRDLTFSKISDKVTLVILLPEGQSGLESAGQSHPMCAWAPAGCGSDLSH